MSKCANCNELVGEEWSANNGLCITCARDEVSSTDTNQASEDRLIIAIETLVGVSLDLGKQAKMMTLADVHTPQAIPDNEKLNMALQPYKDKVLHIIRTEKLKLLAEVRERVVGEDEEQPDFQRLPQVYDTVDLLLERNKLRDEQRENLTKLEAEL